MGSLLDLLLTGQVKVPGRSGGLSILNQEMTFLFLPAGIFHEVN